MVNDSTSHADCLIINSSQLLTLEKDIVNQDLLGSIKDGAVAVRDGLILETGSSLEILKKYSGCSNIINAENSLVMPGFVDCHTHLVFAGNRSSEMEMRLQGADYLDILKSGGGIHSTVRATRAASEKELFTLGSQRLDLMAQNGTTTVEIKSGYGLSEESELKMLKVTKELAEKHSLDIISTYLGAHTIPTDSDKNDYLKWLSGDSLKLFSKYADYFDIFTEEGAYSLEETELLLKAAQKAGFKLKVHGGQFNDLGAPGLAASMGAVSVDHLEKVNDDDLDLMAASDTVAVFLPGVPFFLQSPIYPDAKRFVKKGIHVALATDFNPGSCPSYSMQMMITLGVFSCGMTVPEAILGATLNSARAVNRDNPVGSLKPGKKADLIILNIENPEEIPYYFGTNLVR
ncbi:MAG: imidazolonepropionase, partial [Spirochaetales bacterium]|nr:imidazolonepropionase [Spirochaetales bacterium]